jgi:hypothetical protein
VGNVVLDGEVLCPHEDGHSDFHALTSIKRCRDAQLIAFDLLMLDGQDVRVEPLIERRARLAELLSGSTPALQFSDCIEGDGPAVALERTRRKSYPPAGSASQPRSSDREPRLRRQPHSPAQDRALRRPCWT